MMARRSFPVAVILLLAAGTMPAAQAVRLTPNELAARERTAGQDPVALLRLLPLAPEAEGERLRRRVSGLLAERRANATGAEKEALAAEMAAVLPDVVHSPDEARAILGRPKEVSREVLYRRYVEEWVYEGPAALCLLFDCRTGELPRLQAVYLTQKGKM